MAENKWITEVFSPLSVDVITTLLSLTVFLGPSCGKLQIFFMNIFSSRRTVQTFSLDRLVEMAYDDWSSGRPPGLKKVDEKSETDAENQDRFRHRFS